MSDEVFTYFDINGAVIGNYFISFIGNILPLLSWYAIKFSKKF